LPVFPVYYCYYLDTSAINCKPEYIEEKEEKRKRKRKRKNKK
jgi:hypothetical protein